jgi:transcription initiation factor TFIID subunit 5
MDFSADLLMIAAGSKLSFIQVWSIDGSPILDADPNTKPVNSKRLIGHSGPVYAVSFAPATARPSTLKVDTSPRLLLSASADKTVRLWSMDAWTCLVVYRGHESPIWDVSWGPHGYYFLSCGNDKAARVWAQDKISPLRLFVAHDNDVDVGCWHPNGAYVFTAGDKTVRMWDIMKGTAVRMFSGHAGNITAIACSPNGRTLASADDQGAIFLWDLAAGSLRKRMRGHGKGGIWSLSWSVESSVLVSGGADMTVRAWDVILNQSQTQGSEAKTTIDGLGGASTSTGVVSQKKSKKDVVVTSDQISAFPTKKSPVYKVYFSRSNLVLAGSAFTPDS